MSAFFFSPGLSCFGRRCILFLFCNRDDTLGESTALLLDESLSFLYHHYFHFPSAAPQRRARRIISHGVATSGRPLPGAKSPGDITTRKASPFRHVSRHEHRNGPRRTRIDPPSSLVSPNVRDGDGAAVAPSAGKRERNGMRRAWTPRRPWPHPIPRRTSRLLSTKHEFGIASKSNSKC